MEANDPLAAVGALGDRLRRALYSFVAGQHRAVGRSEAAEATGVTRAAAAFHLDRLVADGLLDVEFRRLGGRQGPGAGRPAKLYRRAAVDIAVSLPPRRYDLAASVLAAAVAEAGRSGEAVDEVLVRVARERGRALAADVEGPSTDAVADVLAAHGYEPVVDGAEVAMANCPFHALVGEHRDLVCGMNLALLDGFAAGLSGQPFTAHLQPDDQHCCVRLTARSTATSSRRSPA